MDEQYLDADVDVWATYFVCPVRCLEAAQRRYSERLEYVGGLTDVWLVNSIPRPRERTLKFENLMHDVRRDYESQGWELDPSEWDLYSVLAVVTPSVETLMPWSPISRLAEDFLLASEDEVPRSFTSNAVGYALDACQAQGSRSITDALAHASDRDSFWVVLTHFVTPLGREPEAFTAYQKSLQELSPGFDAVFASQEPAGTGDVGMSPDLVEQSRRRSPTVWDGVGESEWATSSVATIIRAVGRTDSAVVDDLCAELSLAGKSGRDVAFASYVEVNSVRRYES